jgi:Fe2+ or Zn2+ uptake regulation protein
MAKPIKSTPTLEGEEADKFIEKMLTVEESKITAQQKKIIERIKQNMRELTAH